MTRYYRHRFRSRRRIRRGQRAGALAIGAVVVLFGAGHVAHHHGASIPAGGGYTPASWAQALLAADALPRTSCNLGAVIAWEGAEGGNWANAAAANPLDTTEPEPGSWSINSVGVQAYPSWAAGLRATITTLGNGRYAAILSALSAGDDAQSVADAVAQSPWGTQSFTAEC